MLQPLVDVTVVNTLFAKGVFEPHRAMVWAGSGGCVTPLHYDRCHGFLCQLEGVKTVTLFRPRDTAKLNPRPPITQRAHTSTLSLAQAKVRAPHYEVVMRPGDCLYIPPGWWHHVQTHMGQSSLSVTLAADLQPATSPEDAVVAPHMIK